GLGSFRGAPDDALVRIGADSAVVRCRLETDDGRELLVEAEIARAGRNRIQVNRQRLRRARDLRGVLAVTVFSPEDLELVKGGPAMRRGWIDEVVVAGRPAVDALRTDLERILRQRNALLRQAAGHLGDDIAFTLDVWDAKLAEVGDRLRAERLLALDELVPHLGEAYDAVAGAASTVRADYVGSWGDGALGEALAAVRMDDVRRGVSTVGPHRDEIAITLGGVAARTHGSQGEQRSLALAMRLAADAVVRARTGGRPVLLLDDVFSELDPGRAAALLRALPDGQHILTTAAGVPPAARPDRVLRLHDNRVTEAAPSSSPPSASESVRR
ncbi:MAG: DNA replication/repair protein RecF, partial [Acidimicrobiales bacterium]